MQAPLRDYDGRERTRHLVKFRKNILNIFERRKDRGELGVPYPLQIYCHSSRTKNEPNVSGRCRMKRLR